MSEKLIVSHYENNYGGAVKRLNLITEQLAGLDFNAAPNFLINGLKREELIATNSMILHELFFDGLGEESAPGKALEAAIARDFGSFARWRSEFIAMGKALGGGSGWVLLSYSPRDGKLVNQWAADHCHTLAGRTTDRGTRYVRALLSHRLWRQGGDLRRYVHEHHKLEQCRHAIRRAAEEVAGHAPVNPAWSAYAPGMPCAPALLTFSGAAASAMAEGGLRRRRSPRASPPRRFTHCCWRTACLSPTCPCETHAIVQWNGKARK
jgi:superoxide dismutase